MRIILFILPVLLITSWSSAQECTPDPRPAFFFEDFGSGGNFGPILPAGTTSYAYGGTETGMYVVSNTTDLIVNFWHLGEDHTENDENGYMLLFNASSGPNVFYQRFFADLCPNTEYYFSAEIANIAVPTACIGVAIKPDVRFSVLDPIDETTLFTTTTGEIFYSSFLTWEEFGLRFRTGPEQTELLLQMTNNAVSGCGNDVGIDDVQLRLCNVQTAQTFDLCDLPSGSVTVGGNTYTEPGTYLDALPVPNACNDTLITTTLIGETRQLPTLRFDLCQGEALEIDAGIFTSSISFIDTLDGPVPDCPRFQPYEIDFQNMLTTTQNVTLCDGEQLHVGGNVYTSAGTYTDTLTSTAGCDSLVITNIITGTIEVTTSSSVIEVDAGSIVTLESIISFSDNYSLLWQSTQGLSCNDCLNPTFTATTDSDFLLIATDISSGCTDSAAVRVTLRTCDQIFVPNAFSPNGDRINDRVEVFAEDCFVRLVSWRIFDRWGGLVYTVSDRSLINLFPGWDGQVDGQPAAPGLYGYDLLLEREDGTFQQVRGDIALIR